MKNMGIRPLVVFSKKDGTVEVLLDSDVLGQVCVRVIRDSSGKFDSDIIEAGDAVWNQPTNSAHHVSAKVKVRQAGIKTVEHCLALPSEWVVFGQGDDFDVLTLKRNLVVVSNHSEVTYVGRFALFAS